MTRSTWRVAVALTAIAFAVVPATPAAAHGGAADANVTSNYRTSLTEVPQTTESLSVEGVYGKAGGFVALRHVSRVFGSGDDLNRNTATGVYGAYDAYTTLAARIAWQLDRRIELSLAGENLTNESYAFKKDYPMPGTTAMVGLDLKF